MLVPSYCAIAMTEAMALGWGGGEEPEKKSQRWQHLFAVFLLHDDEDDGREQWVRMYMDEDRRRTGWTNIGLK
jgi:hypothetical protein